MSNPANTFNQALSKIVGILIDRQHAILAKTGTSPFDGYGTYAQSIEPKQEPDGLFTGKKPTDDHKRDNKAKRDEFKKTHPRLPVTFSIAPSDMTGKRLDVMFGTACAEILRVGCKKVTPGNLLKHIDAELSSVSNSSVFPTLFNTNKRKMHTKDDEDLVKYIIGYVNMKLIDHVLDSTDEGRNEKVEIIARMFCQYMRKLAELMCDDAFDTRAEVLMKRSLTKKLTATKATKATKTTDADADATDVTTEAGESDDGSDDATDEESDEESEEESPKTATAKKVTIKESTKESTKLKITPKPRRAPNLYQTITPNQRVVMSFIRSLSCNEATGYSLPSAGTIYDCMRTRLCREIHESNDRFLKTQAKRAEKKKTGNVTVITKGKKVKKDVTDCAHIAVAYDEDLVE
jgi:hypothetical protein